MSSNRTSGPDNFRLGLDPLRMATFAPAGMTHLCPMAIHELGGNSLDAFAALAIRRLHIPEAISHMQRTKRLYAANGNR